MSRTHRLHNLARAVSSSTYRTVLAGLVAAALVFLLATPFFDGPAATTLTVNSLLLIWFAWLSSSVRKSAPDAPIRALELVLLLASTQPLSLNFATILGDNLTYMQAFGGRTHHDGAVLVALCSFVLYGTATAMWWIAARITRWRPPPWRSTLSALPPFTLRALIGLAIASGFARLSFLFPAAFPAALGYSLRLFDGYFSGAVFYLGVGVRKGNRLALIGTFALALLNAFSLVAGNRSHALLFMLFWAAGYVFTAPTSRIRLVGAAALVATLGVGALFVGQVLRTSDTLGRSGEAAQQRLQDLGDRLDEGSSEDVGDSSIRRVLRDSTHAVITLTPEVMPYDREGLLGIPSEFARRALPTLDLGGRSATYAPRNWILNDYGFLVNWDTSYELALVPDAWYRGGYLGLVVVGALLGLFLGLAEQFFTLGLEDAPEKQVPFILICATMPMIEGRDIVVGTRTAILALIAVWSVSFSIAFLRGRRSAPLQSRRHGDAR